MAAKSAAQTAPGSYAVVRMRGRQYLVSAGEKLCVDKVAGNPGDEVLVSEVLLISSGGDEGEAAQRRMVIGNPLVSGAAVKMKILAQTKEPKIRIFKKKRRTGYTKRQGHRQEKTEVLVEDLVVSA